MAQYFTYKGTPTIWLSWVGLEAEMAETWSSFGRPSPFWQVSLMEM